MPRQLRRTIISPSISSYISIIVLNLHEEEQDARRVRRIGSPLDYKHHPWRQEVVAFDDRAFLSQQLDCWEAYIVVRQRVVRTDRVSMLPRKVHNHH